MWQTHGKNKYEKKNYLISKLKSFLIQTDKKIASDKKKILSIR